MYQGSKNKGQVPAAKAQGLPILYHQAAVRVVHAEELLHKSKCPGIAHNHCLWISLRKKCDVGGVVRLHMLDDEIVRLSAAKGFPDIGKPLLAKVLVHVIHDSHLIIQDDIAIVSHAVRHHILSLEKINLMIINAYVNNTVCYIKHSLLLLIIPVVIFDVIIIISYGYIVITGVVIKGTAFRFIAVTCCETGKLAFQIIRCKVQTQTGG